MPELKPLPCPAWACQSVLIELEQDGESFFIVCKECGMRGPVEPDPYHAQQSWDWIPRALTWGNEPPKVEGWYFFRQPGESFDIIRHYPQKLVDVGFDDSKGNKWAGPITPPRE